MSIDLTVRRVERWRSRRSDGEDMVGGDGRAVSDAGGIFFSNKTEAWVQLFRTWDG